jgi:hypothetical protein
MPILNRSRLVPFLSEWGHWRGGLGGGEDRGVQPKIYTRLYNFLEPPGVYIFFLTRKSQNLLLYTMHKHGVSQL